MTRAIGFAVVGLIGLSGCVDTTAIKNFANESSVISSDTAVIDGSDVAFAAVKQYVNAPEMSETYPDVLRSGPGTPEFDESKKVATLAAKVLQKYMEVLGKLAGETSVTGGGDVSGIAASLKTFGVTSPKVTPTLDATAKLANLLTAEYVRAELKEVVEQSNPYVQEITAFLARFARQNATLYDKARIVSGVYWQSKVKGCEIVKGNSPVGCDAIIALATDVHAHDEAVFNQQIDPADAAAAAFEKIGADHQAIVDSAGNFNSTRLLDVLKTDEPVLVGAIRQLSKL
jgi:hypothetical protein